MKGNYDGRLMVKQYVAVVRGRSGQRFQVLETQDPKFYLFSALIGETSIAGGLQFPVRKSELRDDIRSALRHGYGNSF